MSLSYPVFLTHTLIAYICTRTYLAPTILTLTPSLLRYASPSPSTISPRPVPSVSPSFRIVTPVGNKPWQITREAIAEAEAAEDVGNADTVRGGDSGGGDNDVSGPSEWEFDESTEAAFGDGREDGEEAPPPTPILDAYERSRDPVEMERLIQMSFDSLPERAGPQRYNHKRREHQRYKTIRVSCVRCV